MLWLASLFRSLGMAATALAIGGFGGALFWQFDFPLPWMLGSMAATFSVASRRDGWGVPPSWRLFARPVIGVMAGSAFTPSVTVQLLEQWPAIVFVLCYSLAVTCLGYLVFTRLCRFDPATAYFSSTPGGLAEMTLVGASLGGDVRVLTIIHSVRVVLVVTAIPLVLSLFLDNVIDRSGYVRNNGGMLDTVDWLVLACCGIVGFMLANRLRFPGNYLILPMVTSAAVHVSGLTQASPPAEVVSFVQVLIGCIAGARFAGIEWRKFSVTLLIALAWAITMIAAAVGAAWLFCLFFPIPFEAILLATVPGGTAEMLVIGYAIGIDMAFVAASHALRILVVQAGLPLVFLLIAGARKDDS